MYVLGCVFYTYICLHGYTTDTSGAQMRFLRLRCAERTPPGSPGRVITTHVDVKVFPSHIRADLGTGSMPKNSNLAPNPPPNDPARPRTKASQEVLKRAGSILGFMPLPRGAPPKAAIAPPPPNLLLILSQCRFLVTLFPVFFHYQPGYF